MLNISTNEKTVYRFVTPHSMSLVTIQAIAHFTVTGENEARVDLVLLQPFLLYYVNHVVLMITSIF